MRNIALGGEQRERLGVRRDTLRAKTSACTTTAALMFSSTRYNPFVFFYLISSRVTLREPGTLRASTPESILPNMLIPLTQVPSFSSEKHEDVG